MENISYKNFTRNMFFLTFKDKVTAEIYYKSVYSFRKMLTSSVTTYGLVITNLILLHAIEANTNKTGIKQLQLVLLIIEGLLIILFIIWEIVTSRLKKIRYFYPVYILISTINTFNIYLQPFIMKEAITNSANSLTLMALFPFVQFFAIMAFLFFIENNFMIYLASFSLTLALSMSLSISINWEQSIIMPVLQFVGCFLFCFFAYFVNKRDKNHFILYRNATTELEKKKSLFQNLNSGLITIDEYGCDYNLKIKEYLDISSNRGSLTSQNFIQPKSTLTEYDTCSPLSNKKIANFGIKSLLFENYLEINPALDKKVKGIFQISNKLSDCKEKEEIEIQYDKTVMDLMKLMKLKEVYQSYMHVGDKVISKSIDNSINFQNVNTNHKDTFITLRIYLRFNLISSSLEFLLNDISSVIEVEKMKAAVKYKKLFLNKFSHEFKNPLLNIIQLVSDLKDKIRNRNSFSNLENASKSSFNSITCIAKYRSSRPASQNSSSNYKPTYKSNLMEIKHIKNLTMYLTSLISDFDFVSNSEANQPKIKIPINNPKPQLKSPIGQSFIELSKFRLAKIITQCVSILQTKIDLSEKNIKVTSKIDENIPYEIFSDHRRLKQVICNLLWNAFKFTIMGEISITVRKDALNDNLINFEICDTGMGFREDILQMIQEGNTHLLFGNINTGGNIYGCGIGLELVENIISRIGKNFKISSKMNEGSKITFSLFNNLEIRNEIDDTNIFEHNRSLNKQIKYGISNLSQNSNSFVKSRGYIKRRSISSKNNEFKFLSLNSLQDLKFKLKRSDIRMKTIIKNTEKISIFKINDIKEMKVKLDYKNCKETESNQDKEIDKQIINCEDESSNDNDSNADEENDKTLIQDKIIRIDPKYKLKINKSVEIDFDLNISKASSHTKFNNSLRLDCISKNDIYLSIGSVENEDKSESIRLKYKSQESKITSQKSLIRILLVDDEKFIRQSESNQIKKFFKSKPNYEYEVTECSDGIECLYYIYKGMQEGIKYDYIITDESMNFMRGTVMIKIINTLIEENIMYRIKRFIVTSYEPWAIINAHGSICDGIISKPLTYENLTAILEN